MTELEKRILELESKRCNSKKAINQRDDELEEILSHIIYNKAENAIIKNTIKELLAILT